MLERIEAVARFTVAKACGFAILAIATLMTGLAADFPVALKAGGFLSLITSMVLVLCAWRAPTKSYKSTELWLLLDPADRPSAETAQGIISTVLREAYLRFALHGAWLGAGMLSAAFVFGWLRMAAG